MGIRSVLKHVLTKTRTIEVAKDLYCAFGGVVYRPEAEWIHHLFGARRDVFFVQIGAHDGKSNDNVYSVARALGWHGVLVEPVRYLFDRLVQNYCGSTGI